MLRVLTQPRSKTDIWPHPETGHFESPASLIHIIVTSCSLVATGRRRGPLGPTKPHFQTRTRRKYERATP